MKRKLTSLLCVLVFAISMIPSASALEGEALRAADTLAALNLVDSAGGLKEEYTIEGLHIYGDGYAMVLKALLPLLQAAAAQM